MLISSCKTNVLCIWLCYLQLERDFTQTQAMLIICRLELDAAASVYQISERTRKMRPHFCFAESKSVLKPHFYFDIIYSVFAAPLPEFRYG